jgi:hypothetical protein
MALTPALTPRTVWSVTPKYHDAMALLTTAGVVSSGLLKRGAVEEPSQTAGPVIQDGELVRRSLVSCTITFRVLEH